MQTFRACHLCTFNVAAIFFRGHPYIWRTTVRHDYFFFWGGGGGGKIESVVEEVLLSALAGCDH